MLFCEQRTNKYQRVACQFAEECFQTTSKPFFPYGDDGLEIHEVGRQQFESINKCYKNASDSFSGFPGMLGEWRTQRIRELFHSAEILRQREIEGLYDTRVVCSDLVWEIFSDHPKIKIMGCEIKTREYATYGSSMIKGGLGLWVMVLALAMPLSIVWKEIEPRFIQIAIGGAIIVGISVSISLVLLGGWLESEAQTVRLIEKELSQ